MSDNYIVVLTGPSGVGKSSLVNQLVDQGWKKCITCTTREPRDYEKDGVDYYFLSEEKFLAFQEQDLFMETNQHYGQRYGVRRADLEVVLKDSHVVVLLNWEGAVKVENSYGNTLVIHIDPPSITELEKRLTGREDQERLRYAKEDISHSSQFKHHIVNDNLEETAIRLIKLLEKVLPST